MENTKQDGISSGLVAVAWMDYSCDPLVRLSDAEAIISAKGAEIERLKKDATTWLNGSNISQARIEQQAERIKELERERDEYKHDAHCCDIEFRDVRDSYDHFKALSVKQSAALKLAKDALSNTITNELSPDFGTIALWRVKEALAAIDALKGE